MFGYGDVWKIEESRLLKDEVWLKNEAEDG